MKTRNIREVKVGDIVRDNLGDEHCIQEVLPNSFAIAGRPTMLRRLEWVEKGFAEEQGWGMPLNVPKEVGVDDSEEVELDEMDINNILRALDYFKEHNSICNVWITGQLIEKLNKMLKEKNETAKA